MVSIYVLELECGKYYIGKTNNPQFRLSQHFSASGSAWTSKYHPLRVIEIINDCDDFDEDKYTKIYMSKYGIDNVRGGAYCQLVLSPSIRDYLVRELRGANNQCFLCGSSEHFSNKCNNMREVWLCDYCDEEFDDMGLCLNHEQICKIRLEECKDSDMENLTIVKLT